MRRHKDMQFCAICETYPCSCGTDGVDENALTAAMEVIVHPFGSVGGILRENVNPRAARFMMRAALLAARNVERKKATPTDKSNKEIRHERGCSLMTDDAGQKCTCGADTPTDKDQRHG